MKIIGFNASPRKAGNTAWTVNQILEGAWEAGAETQVWHASDLNIRPCAGCLRCVQGDGCAINDDMQALYGALALADALVLGAPIYMGQMSAQAKTFTDRLFAHIKPRFSPQFKEQYAGKALILAFTQGNPDPDRFQTYYSYTSDLFRLLEFDVRDTVVITGTRSEPARDRKELHSAMKIVGSSLASAQHSK